MLLLVYAAVTLIILVVAIASFTVVSSNQATWKRSTVFRFLGVFTVGASFGFSVVLLLITIGTLNPKDKGYRKEVLSITEEYSDVRLNSSYVPQMLRLTEEEVFRRMSQEVRVLCWVMTSPENHRKKAVHVRNTWGRHCTTMLFVSDGEDSELPAINLGIRPGRDGLWSKTVEAFKYVYQHHQEDYDWVLKADDDTFVIVENLHKMLLPYSPSDPVYFGFHFKPHVEPQGYMSGGAGYVLSKEAVRRLVDEAFNGTHSDCQEAGHNGAEDLNIGQCLQSVGVKPGDSRDGVGRHRFLPLNVDYILNPDQGDKQWWFWTYMVWPVEDGPTCCSDEPAAFHYMNSYFMYIMEFLVYHVKPFSVRHVVKATDPPKITPKIEALPTEAPKEDKPAPNENPTLEVANNVPIA